MNGKARYLQVSVHNTFGVKILQGGQDLLHETVSVKFRVKLPLHDVVKELQYIAYIKYI